MILMFALSIIQLRLTEKNLQQNLWSKVTSPFPETLPQYLIQKYNLMPLTDALRNIHFPKDEEALAKARFRLKFEELFYIQLNILSIKAAKNLKSQGFVFNKVGDIFNKACDKGNPRRFSHGTSVQPSVAGRCGQRQDPCGSFEHAYCFGQWFSSLPDGSHRNTCHSALCHYCGFAWRYACKCGTAYGQHYG